MYLICHVNSQDHVTEDHMTLWARHSTKFGGHLLCGSGDAFNFSRDPARPRD